MDKTTVLTHRLHRHHLAQPVDSEQAYVDLFRLAQPVSTCFNTAPGAPPTLAPRSAFDDLEMAGRLRRPSCRTVD